MSNEGNISERKLTNKDFRNIVLTARSTRAIDPKVVNLSEQPKKVKLKQPYLHKLKERPNRPKTKTEDVPETPYRDRAKERREGQIKNEMDLKELSSISNKSINQISKVAFNESNEKNIEEIKLLVNEENSITKGLDYDLLQKTKSQINSHKKELEIVPAEKILEDNCVHINSIFAKNIYNIIFENTEKDQREIYLPGRKIFVYNINYDYTESFIPIISTRSKQKPSILEEKSSKIASEAIISKLNQILSYLRGDSQKPDISKQHKFHKEQNKSKEDFSIYEEDIGEYNPQETIKKYKDEKNKSRSYFDESKNPPTTQSQTESMIKDLTEEALELRKKRKVNIANKEVLKMKLMKLTAEDESYIEGIQHFDDIVQTTICSDDEIEKMESNKKSLINPWDFATQEEYEKYINTKNQIAKGIRPSKMKNVDKKDKKHSTSKEKAKLDKQWDKINTIMSERKFNATFEDNTDSLKGKKKI